MKRITLKLKTKQYKFETVEDYLKRGGTITYIRSKQTGNNKVIRPFCFPKAFSSVTQAA